MRAHQRLVLRARSRSRLPVDPRVVTTLESWLNEAFAPYERLLAEMRLTGAKANAFKEGFEASVLFSMFREQLARELAETAAYDRHDNASAIPED